MEACKLNGARIIQVRNQDFAKQGGVLEKKVKLFAHKMHEKAMALSKLMLFKGNGR